MIQNRLPQLAALLLSFVLLPAHADRLRTAKPESVGMSSERLGRIAGVMQRHITSTLATSRAPSPPSRGAAG